MQSQIKVLNSRNKAASITHTFILKILSHEHIPTFQRNQIKQ
jgi:hypothetical protein